ncbi:MAG: AI-2E family transporter [bacterium]|nr:AI-2E family transporter [bacterium]
MPKKIEISHRTIIFTVLFLLTLWLLVQLRHLILILFLTIILTSALNPLVDRLERLRLPRWLAILLLYVFFIALFALALSLIVPPLIDQTSTFIDRSDLYLGQLAKFGIDSSFIASQLGQIGLVPANVIRTTVGFFSNIISLVFLIIITFYVLLERKNLKHYLTLLFGQGKEAQAEDFINKIERQLGGWVRGELILMTLIGILTYIGLRILGIDFALPLALLAGLLEVVPNFGPIISAIPAVLIGFTISPIIGFSVIALYFLIHQFEGALIVPKVMQRAVGVNPVILILSIAAGVELAGTVGAILSVPSVLIIKVILEQIKTKKGTPDL